MKREQAKMFYQITATSRKPFEIVKASAEVLNTPIHPKVVIKKAEPLTVQKFRYSMNMACLDNNIMYKESSTKPEAAKQSILKKWLKNYDTTLGYASPVELMQFFIKNWRKICSGMRGVGHNMPFLNNPNIFDTLNFFERPTYRSAIIDFIESLSYVTAKHKFFGEQHEKIQDSVFGALYKDRDTDDFKISDDSMKIMRDRLFGGCDGD